MLSSWKCCFESAHGSLSMLLASVALSDNVPFVSCALGQLDAEKVTNARGERDMRAPPLLLRLVTAAGDERRVRAPRSRMANAYGLVPVSAALAGSSSWSFGAAITASMPTLPNALANAR